MNTTRFKELLYGHYPPIGWRFVDAETGALVGPAYATRAELLGDLDRYAFDSWGLL
jgi:hypothetical protein